MQTAVPKVIVNEWNVLLIDKSNIFFPNPFMKKIKRSKQAWLDFQSSVTQRVKKARPLDQSE